MKTRGSGMVGYNVQAAVDAKHHLIETHEVTNDGVDLRNLGIRTRAFIVEADAIALTAAIRTT